MSSVARILEFHINISFPQWEHLGVFGWQCQPGPPKWPQLWRPCRVGEGYLLKRLQFAVSLQAHPSGLRAFPVLNGSFWCLPTGNLPATTLPQGNLSFPREAEPKTQEKSGKIFFVMWQMRGWLSVSYLTKMNEMAGKLLQSWRTIQLRTRAWGVCSESVHSVYIHHKVLIL